MPKHTHNSVTQSTQNSRWWVFLAGLVIVACCVLALTASQWLSFTVLREALLSAVDFFNTYPQFGFLLFAVLYCLICSVPMPLVSIPTMMAGYLYGHVTGLLIVSFASALGGTLLFLLCRYLFRDWVQAYLQRGRGHYLPWQRLTESNSFSAALSARLIPGLPFFIPAIALSASKISTLKFYLSTQCGLLMTLLVYVNAGQSLTTLQSFNDILSPRLVIAMLLIAVVPLLLKYLVSRTAFFKTQQSAG